MKYPTDKKEILNKAKENNAQQEDIDALDTLPEGQYANPTEVTEALSDSSPEDSSDDEM